MRLALRLGVLAAALPSLFSLNISGASPASADSQSVILALGSGHTCFVYQGSVQCAGLNDHGQLGDGTQFNHLAPVAVGGLTGVTGLAAAGHHTCALLATGKVMCWGANGFGQLGDGSTSDSSRPVEVKNLQNVAAIATGGYFSCALLVSKEVRCWGGNQVGQLGNGSNEVSTSAAGVLSLTDVRQIAAGGAHACAISASRGLLCWGQNKFGQLGSGDTINTNTPVQVQNLGTADGVFLGAMTSCAHVSSGTMGIYCWGNNSSGQMATGLRSRSVLIPQYVGDYLTAAIGFSHACFERHFFVQCAGMNSGYQGEQLSPPAKTLLQQVVAGDSHNCGLVWVQNTSGITIGCWGFNGSGQLMGPNTVLTRHFIARTLAADLRILGQVQVGGKLTVEGQVIPTPDARVCSLLRNGVEVKRATSCSYTLTAQDLNQIMTFRIQARKVGYVDLDQTLNTTGPVKPGQMTVGSVTLSGESVVGKVLKASTTAWLSGAKISYQWMRDSKAISGATNQSYTLTKIDRGHMISVVVMQKSAGYLDASSVSAEREAI